jgi:hypothetical protein
MLFCPGGLGVREAINAATIVTTPPTTDAMTVATPESMASPIGRSSKIVYACR